MGYSKQVYQRASAELLRRKTAAREQTEARWAEIDAKIPEIAKIREEMARTAMAVTKTIIATPQKASETVAALMEKNLELQRKRAALLEAAGYPGDYLAEKKACEICGGNGYAGAEMCECLHGLLKKEAYVELGAVSQIKNCSFEDFTLDMYPEQQTGGVSPRMHMTGVYDACRQYAKDFSREAQSLLMIGRTGLGKTHLSLAIAKEVTNLGYGVVYTSVQKLMDKLESQKFSYSAEAKEQYARDMENVLGCDLLVLDDLGAEFITQFSASALYNIVNTRLVEGRPAIISTNLEPSEIEAKYSQRMLSRLMGCYRALKFFGKDIRFVKKTR